ncbi:MAG TPA: AAA family ATPase [Actinomycetes bacterium]|nr:AAA family ATPase [Actinomycetes bacterium]
MDVSWRLVGRRAELEALSAAIGDAGGGGVVLAGAAGVGKTRLVREALTQAQGAGREVEWVAATRAAASIPFAAVSHLLPQTEHLGDDRLDTLRRAAVLLAERSRGRPLVLAVDDAHLLDDASAALVHLLVLRGLAVVLATVRAGAPAPDSVVALWKDGLARRLELSTLAPEATAELLSVALGGPVDGVTRQEVLRVTEGNPQHLRELVLGGLETGALRRFDGVWRWKGGWAAATRLVELVEARLGALGETARAAVELVAWGEPLPVGVLERLVDQDAVEAAERSGQLTVERSGRRLLARLAHPLYGEVLRVTLPVSRARAVAEQLAAAFGTGGLRRRDDLLRVGAWQLEAGVAARPALLLEAAGRAAARFDHELTERLLRAAVDAGGGPAAVRFLAETLERQGRHAEAVAVMDREPPGQGSQAERARWASIRAGNLYWGLERTAEAEEILRQAAVAEDGGEEAVAMLAWILLFDGRLLEAVAVSGRVLDRPGSSAQALVWASTAAVPALGSLGRLGEALAVAGRGLAVATAHREELPWGETQLNLACCQLLLGAGRLTEARTIADAGYQAAVADRSPEQTGGWAGFRGLVAKAQGQVATAEASFREAVALLDEQDPYRFMRCCLAELASMAAIRGDQPAAAAWLDRADTRQGSANRLFDAWVELDRAWVAAGAGELTRAGRLAGHAAEMARSSGQFTFEAVALHDVGRLGAPAEVQGRLEELAGLLQGRLVPVLATSAAAMAAGDGAALDRVAAAFEDLGALLLAAEAAAAAARAHRAAGRDAKANASQERAATLAAACQGARTPALASGALASALTAREREVAMLAAARTSSREIAARLSLSVRTVDNHLSRIYAKLGISSRAQLDALLRVGTPR